MCFHVWVTATRSEAIRALKSESDWWTDGAVFNNFNRQRRGRSCKNSQDTGHACKTVIADLSQKKGSAARWTTKQTRDTDMLAYGCALTRVSRSTQVSYVGGRRISLGREARRDVCKNAFYECVSAASSSLQARWALQNDDGCKPSFAPESVH